MNKWKFKDYLDFYEERAAIQSEACIYTVNQAEMQAANATLALFKDQEKPTDKEIREFRIFMRKNKNNG